MARILNLEAYPLAETISDLSYLVGTDVTDNKETKNFKIEDLKTHILPAPLTPSGTFENATVVVDADGQISSVTQGASGSSKWSFSPNNNDIYRNSNVGIGDFSAADPAGALEVQGKIQVSGADAEFVGDINGAIRFNAKAGEALSKGDVVYISEISGNIPVVSKADASDAAKMPAFGLAFDAASLNSSVEVITFGTLSSIDTSAFSLGDTVYVSTTAGGLTNTPPTGEANLLQNIGKVQRVQASSGSIKVGGAGRTNATPNLNQGSLFIGDASNQSSTLAIGGANTFLKSDGTTASWAAIPSGVTSVNTTDSFVTITDPTTTPSISIGEASGTATGVLSSTDWTTFNNKTSNTGTVTGITSNTLNQLTVTNGSSSAELDILTATVAVGETALATGDQIASYVSSEISSIGAVTATSGASTQVAVFDGTDSIVGDSDFTFGAGILKVEKNGLVNLQLSSAGTSAPAMYFVQSGGTLTAPTATTDGDILGVTNYFGYNGTTEKNAGAIRVAAAEDWSDVVGSQTNGSLMRFSTVTNGDISLTEKYLIDGDGNHTFTGNVGIGTTPISGKALAVGGNSIISGQLDLDGSGDSKLKLISYLHPTTGEKYSNYMEWYKSDGTTRRGYVGFTEEDTFRINVQESGTVSQIILDADEVILNSTSETQSATIKSGVWEGTPIADAYIAEDYLTATNGLANRIAVFNGTDSVEGFSTFTYDSATTSFKVSSPSDDDYSEFTNNGITQVRSTDDANLSLICYGDQSKAAEIQSFKYRNTLSSPEALESGDLIASHRHIGWDGSAINTSLYTKTFASEDWTGSGAGVYYVIDTCATGETTPTERYRIDEDGHHKFTGNVGIGTTANSILDVQGGNGEFQVRLDDSNFNKALLNSSNGSYANIFSAGSDTANAEFQFGIIGSTATALNQVGSVNDSFILATSSADDMNFINTEGTGTTDNIGFYVGKPVADTLASTTPDLIILGSTANKGNVGVGTATPNEKLEVNGNVRVDGQAYSTIQTSTYTPTASFIIDWDLGNVAIVDLGSASGTIGCGFSNLKPGANYFIKVIQHATTPVNLSWPSTGGAGGTYWPGGTAPTISTGASAVDGIALTCISANEVLANFSQDYQ